MVAASADNHAPRARLTTVWLRRRISPDSSGATLIYPFDHDDVVTGGVGLEIFAWCLDARTIITGCADGPDE
jgi:hypothetical protein